VRDDHYWPEWDSEGGPPTERVFGEQPPAEFVTEEPPDAAEDALVGELLDTRRVPSPWPSRRGKRFLGRVLMVTGGVLVLGAILYTVDLILSAGEVPRGVVVAGVDVGGMNRADAEAQLRRELEPRLTQPVPILAGDVRASLDPIRSGLGLDWPSTLAQAGRQPLDPLDRIKSFFTKRSVDVVTWTDPDTLAQALTTLATEQLNHPPTEGGIGFRKIAGSDGGVTAYPIEPRAGQALIDVREAATIIRTGWLDRDGVRIPVELTPVKATSAGVHAALDQVVAPAVARPLTVRGDGADAILKPDAIAAAMQFAAQDGGALEVNVDPTKLRQVLQQQLATTEKPGKDAQIVFSSGVPTVQPSEDARRIDWTGTLTPLMDVLRRTDGRELAVRYQSSKPALTTEDVNALGVNEIVGEFTTGGLSGAVAANVEAMAAKVNGAILRPGQTFSLSARTGAFSQGYVPAPVNEDGSGPVVLGGGSSQFATTLYNAEYFAGLTDAGHTEHAYYLDRYPPGRDAISVRDNGSPVDLKFTDNLTGGVAIQAEASGSTVTVRIWGSRQYRVESVTGLQTGTSPPPIQALPPGCVPSTGAAGFAVTDTRVLYDLASGGEVRRDTRTVTYAPRPAVVC
jgi:vancomycin resistance protein YoaR